MASSPLAGAIEFLKEFGFYDVVLPFLLAFTIVYAVLEKTKIFGSKESKKNINAMIAFVIALFFVATTQLVEGTKEMLPNIVIILIALMSFMMLVGFFYTDKEFSFEQHKFWKVFLTIIMFICVILLFWHAFFPEEWEWFWVGNMGFWSSTPGVTIIFLLIVIGTVLFVTLGGKKGGE